MILLTLSHRITLTMPRTEYVMKVATASMLLALLTSGFAPRNGERRHSTPPVEYPDGYRQWAHVKSALISPGHQQFASMGGFQHVYANPPAMIGYRTRAFPEGAIVVVDWLEMRDNSGAFVEGARRQIDVMVKDSARFKESGGWGFQRYVKDSKTELAARPSPQECFACHSRLKKDALVLSSYRP